MKATGIVRRIDDLGRIVVPKEIRRTLRIREGDPLEIFTDREGEIILKKYSPIGELSQFAGEYAESLAQTTGHPRDSSKSGQFYRERFYFFIFGQGYCNISARCVVFYPAHLFYRSNIGKTCNAFAGCQQ